MVGFVNYAFLWLHISLVPRLHLKIVWVLGMRLASHTRILVSPVLIMNHERPIFILKV